jgi:hypothetical protein
MSGAAVAADDVAVLKQLVVRHKVCWEVVPIWHVPLGGEKVKIGFEVDLFGTHDHPTQPSPGCEECHTVFSDLRRIANAVMPPSDRASRYVLEPYDVSLHFSPRRKMRKDVVVAIDIVHRDHFDGHVDECETRCLCEIERALRALGACPSIWSPLRPASEATETDAAEALLIGRPTCAENSRSNRSGGEQ